MKARIEWLDDSEGNLTKFLVTDSRLEILHLIDGDSEPELFALVLTDEIEAAIKSQYDDE